MAIALPLALTACGSVRPASVAGECKIFAPPPEPIQGVRTVDKRWIAKQVEAGIAGCGWARPKAGRPPNA